MGPTYLCVRCGPTLRSRRWVGCRGSAPADGERLDTLRLELRSASAGSSAEGRHPDRGTRGDNRDRAGRLSSSVSGTGWVRTADPRRLSSGQCYWTLPAILESCQFLGSGPRITWQWPSTTSSTSVSVLRAFTSPRSAPNRLARSGRRLVADHGPSDRLGQPRRCAAAHRSHHEGPGHHRRQQDQRGARSRLPDPRRMELVRPTNRCAHREADPFARHRLRRRGPATSTDGPRRSSARVPTLRRTHPRPRRHVLRRRPAPRTREAAELPRHRTRDRHVADRDQQRGQAARSARTRRRRSAVAPRSLLGARRRLASGQGRVRQGATRPDEPAAHLRARPTRRAKAGPPPATAPRSSSALPSSPPTTVPSSGSRPRPRCAVPNAPSATPTARTARRSSPSRPRRSSAPAASPPPKA